MDKNTENAIVSQLAILIDEVRGLKTEIKNGLDSVNQKLDHQTDVMNKGFEETHKLLMQLGTSVALMHGTVDRMKDQQAKNK